MIICICFRVALQYEFTKLHLDDVLERLKNHESEELAVQISAYVDNEFDIAVLMEEAEEKVAAMERVADLEDEVGRLNETMQELEVNAMATQVRMYRVTHLLAEKVMLTSVPTHSEVIPRRN